MSGSECFNAEGLVVSAHYAEVMNETVLPWLRQRRTDTIVQGGGNRPLFVSRFDADNPRGTVLIVHGFTENAEKFAELIYSLVRGGFCVCAWDQRGHGRSWRDESIADPSLTHVDDFNDYVRDMECVCARMLGDLPAPHMAFAHSMGGAVTALYLARHPELLSRATLCAPMIAPNLSGLPALAGMILCGSASLLGQRKKRLFASKPYSGPENFDTSCATGRERFDWYEALRQARPEFRNNGPTYGWTLEAVRATQMILKPGAVERIQVPVRLYTAQNDTMVLPGAQQQFAQRLQRGERILVKNAKHEIYRSDDATLFPWWRDVLGFLAQS